jgi:serine/threonine protein kinase
MPTPLRFDHYEVIQHADGSPHELGRGAMGITYKAIDTNLRVPVALKVINAAYLESEVARQRFIREARSAAKLRHRNVASVFHLGTEGGQCFYTMEYIDGETVDALIKREGPLRPVLGLEIAAQVARALNAAHPHGLVHRDIKPSNLMVVQEDDELVAKVIDFGLVKSFLPEDGSQGHATVSMGGFVGTPHFASPEQLEEREVDVRSDIYSLGVTLWYMLSGQTPFAGSTAQVMSQHLSKPPPLEKLQDIPLPVASLLRRLLEKDPARRPQTPNELRREIESSLAELTGSAPPPCAAPQPELASDDFDTVAEDPVVHNTELRMEPGATLGGRFKLLQSVGETPVGRIFHAMELAAPTREVRLCIIHPEVQTDPNASALLESDLGKAQGLRHPNLLGIHGAETIQTTALISMEWTRGFPLLDVLRARRELTAAEVIPLLHQAATGLDHALSHGLHDVDLVLQQILLHFPSTDASERVSPIERAPLSQVFETRTGQILPKEAFLRAPLEAWSRYQIKLQPLGITRQLCIGATWAGDQTILSGLRTDTPLNVEPVQRYIQGLARIAYEMLGGILPAPSSRGPQRRYPPLANLSEHGNEILRQAFAPAPHFQSAQAFIEALAAAVGLDPTPKSDSEPGNLPGLVAPAAPQPDQNAEPVLGIPNTGSKPEERPPSAARRFGVPLTLTLASIAALGTGVLLWDPFGSPRTRLETPPGAAPVPEVESDRPEPAKTPAKTVELEASPPQSPERKLQAALETANDLEKKEDWPNAIRAWLRIGSEFSEKKSAKTHLEIILQQLRARSKAAKQSDFEELREPVRQITDLQVVGAMLYLAENLREKEPSLALKWYEEAAEHGDTTALIQMGLLLSNGPGGISADVRKAFECFKKAADKGDNDAKYLLGECYLRGNGTNRDEKRGIALLEESSQGGNLFAKDLLGTCYHRGVGVEKDPSKALRLFTEAADRDYGVSCGNLGVLCINGDGMAQADPQKAVKLFLKGIRLNDPMSFFHYARCLENGIGVPASASQAQEFYLKAAEVGVKQAAEWCQKRGIQIPQPK